MKKLKMWYIRNFKIIDYKTAIDLGLIPFRDIYGDEINRLNCRSIWKDRKGNQYRVQTLIRCSDYFRQY